MPPAPCGLALRLVAAHKDEPGAVVGGVVDVGGDHLALVHLGRQTGADGHPRPLDAAHAAHRFGGRVGGLVLDAVEVLADELAALAVGVRDADDLGDPLKVDRAPGDELLVDLPGDLAHDAQLVEAEGQAVEGNDHRAFDRVLDGHDAQRRVAGLHRLEHVADRRVGERVVLAGRQVGQQGLLGEGALGAQKGDRLRGAAAHSGPHGSSASSSSSGGAGGVLAAAAAEAGGGGTTR